MLGRPPYSTRTYTPFPHTTLFGSSPDQPGAVAPPLLGVDRYGWGCEELDIPVLDVPQPLLGQPLVLIAGEQGRYTLLNEADDVLLEGTDGELVKADGIALKVDTIKDHPGYRNRHWKGKMGIVSIDLVVDRYSKQKNIKSGKTSN